MATAPDPIADATPEHYWSTRKRDVPYVPTDEQVVRALLKFAAVTPHDTVYDLGCGDGRVVIAAAELGAHGVGVDIDPQRYVECLENLRRVQNHTGHTHDGSTIAQRVRFILGSLWDLSLRDASVVFLYLLPKINCLLRPKLLAELPTGARVIANSFGMGDGGLGEGGWSPDVVLEVHHRKLMKWIIPAWLEGRWLLTFASPSHRPRRIDVTLVRHFQRVTGAAYLSGPCPTPLPDRHTGRREVPISGQILARQLTFTLPDPWQGNRILRFVGHTEGSAMATLRGEYWEEGSEAWSGSQGRPWWGHRIGPAPG